MDLEVLVSAEPTKVSPDPLFLTATEEITQKPVTLIREHGGSDARFICGYGIPVIMSRPYVGNLHAENEWIDIASMETLYRIYERYLEKKLRLERHHREDDQKRQGKRHFAILPFSGMEIPGFIMSSTGVFLPY